MDEVSARPFSVRRDGRGDNRLLLLQGLIRGTAGAVRPRSAKPNGCPRLGCISFTGLPPSLKRSRSVPPCALARRPSPEAPPVRLAGLDYPATAFTPPVFRRQEPGSGSLAKAKESCLLYTSMDEREQIAIHGFVKNPKLLRPSQTPRPEQPRLRPSLFSSFLDCFQIDRPINTTRTLAPLAFLFGITLHRLCQCDDSFQVRDFRRLNIKQFPERTILQAKFPKHPANPAPTAPRSVLSQALTLSLIHI